MLFNGPYIGKCFELYGEYSESEVEVIRTLNSAGNTIIDIGANIGALTVPMSRIVGDTGRVYAIESHSDSFNILCANLALNGIKNVKPINAFVENDPDADTSGVWGKYGYVSETWAPPIISLDSIELEACDFIKIDTDGRELKILISGMITIDLFRPIIYFENDHRASSPELLSFVGSLGYDMYWHVAPIFLKDNFFNNPVNFWEKENIVSTMVLAIPQEKNIQIQGMKKIFRNDEWWKAD